MFGNVSNEKLEKIFRSIIRSQSISSLELSAIYNIPHEAYMLFYAPVIEKRLKKYNKENPKNKVCIQLKGICRQCRSIYPPYTVRKCPKCGGEVIDIIYYTKDCQENTQTEKIDIVFTNPLSRTKFRMKA